MKKVLTSLAFFSCLAFAASDAHAFGIGADAGFSRIMNGDGANGFGLDVYLRPLPLPLIEPELQIGAHRFTLADGAVTSMNIPIMVGARVGLPVPMISPFVGAHVGIMYSRSTIEILGESQSGSDNNVAFNVGGGLNLLDLPLIDIGVCGWYYIITAEEGGEAGKMLMVGVNGSFGL